MNLLIADTIFPKGHKILNEHIIQLLSQRQDKIKVINYKKYYKNWSENNIRNYNLHYLFKCQNPYLDYLCQIVNTVILIFRCFTIRYDSIIFFTFDTIAFAFLHFTFKKPIYIFHHNNTDHLQNKYKLLFFKTYMNHVNHIVFTDFIKDFLINIGVNNDKIHVLSHPLPIKKETTTNYKIKNNKEHIYIALGHANDEELVQKLINHEINTHELENHKIKIIIRSICEYKNLPHSLQIINYYLSQTEYEYYNQIADGVLILYSASFQYRFSGALLDAFAHKKKIIGRNIPIVNYFKEKYPNNFTVFHGISDLIYKLSHLDNKFDENSYDSFLLSHSGETIKSQLNEILL